jgi:uncharacterized protein YceK
LTAGLICALGGCGTLVNLSNEGDPAPEMKKLPMGVYGGVRTDAQLGKSYLKESFSGRYPGWASIYGFSVGSYLLSVDLPLSAVGDTLTLPWSVVAVLTSPAETPAAAKDGERHAAAAKPHPAEKAADSETEE